MGVVIETCTKHQRGRKWIKPADVCTCKVQAITATPERLLVSVVRAVKCNRYKAMTAQYYL
jgi:hypothetical protein